MTLYPHWLKSTCMISDRENEEIPDKVKSDQLKVIGSAILLSYKMKGIIITAAHVARKCEFPIYSIYLEEEDQSKFFPIDRFHSENNLMWRFHKNPNIDLAVSFVVLPPNFPPIDESWWIPFSQVKLGADISILGYPLGLTFGDNVSPVRKKGSVARKVTATTKLSEDLILPEKSFLVDGFIDTGNSGSPVIQESQFGLIEYQESIKSKDGHEFVDIIPKMHLDKNIREGIIGVAISHFFSKDLKRHAGLGIALSIDYVKEIIESREMQTDFKRLDSKNPQKD